jgi:hypothetical protein
LVYIGVSKELNERLCGMEEAWRLGIYYNGEIESQNWEMLARMMEGVLKGKEDNEVYEE